MIKLEALADSLAFYHRAFDADSDAYKLRNPGLLPAVSLSHQRDEKGNRKFKSVLDGYQALLFDLKVKCTGQSVTRPKLALDSTLADLLAVYGQGKPAAKYIAKFLTKALGFEVTVDTHISQFVGE